MPWGMDAKPHSEDPQSAPPRRLHPHRLPRGQPGWLPQGRRLGYSWIDPACGNPAGSYRLIDVLYICMALQGVCAVCAALHIMTSSVSPTCHAFRVSASQAARCSAVASERPRSAAPSRSAWPAATGTCKRDQMRTLRARYAACHSRKCSTIQTYDFVSSACVPWWLLQAIFGI